jgi:Domain of unknown function (DUF4430)
MDSRVATSVGLRARLIALLVIVAAASVAGGGNAAERRAEPKAKTVRLAIDYGDGVQKVFSAVPWKDGQTVLDVLQWADKHPRGIELQLSGSGTSAFVRSIDKLANEGGGASAKNWLYWQNGKLANTGAGTREVAPGDEVLWKFDVYRPGGE